MKKLLGFALILAVFAMPVMAGANIVCPVTDDINATMGNPAPWYPVAKPMTVDDRYGGWDMPSFVRFDVSGLEGIPSSQISSATFHFYAWRHKGSGPAHTGHPTASENPVTGEPWLGGDIYPVINKGWMNNKGKIVDESSCENWNEMNFINWAYMPASSVMDTEGDYPSATYFHLGIENWGSADITSIVKFWAENDYDNAYGINFWDLDDPEAEEGWGKGDIILYFLSKDYEGEPGFPETDAYMPYLEVNLVPIPGAIWLLGSGLIGLLGFRRRQKAIHMNRG